MMNNNDDDNSDFVEFISNSPLSNESIISDATSDIASDNETIVFIQHNNSFLFSYDNPVPIPHLNREGNYVQIIDGQEYVFYSDPPMSSTPTITYSINEYSQVLNKNDLSKIQKLTLDELQNKTKISDENICCICLDKILQSHDQNFCILPCNHCLHYDCIIEALKKYDHRCPICREKIGESYSRTIVR